MTSDDDGLEPVLKAKYLGELRKALGTFAEALGLKGKDDVLLELDAISRLFARYESFPAYSAWRRETLREELGEASLGGSEGALPSQTTTTIGTPEQRGQNAFNAWKMKSLENASYDHIMEILKTKRPSAVFQGRNGKWYFSNNATAEDFAEAFR